MTTALAAARSEAVLAALGDAKGELSADELATVVGVRRDLLRPLLGDLVKRGVLVCERGSSGWCVRVDYFRLAATAPALALSDTGWPLSCSRRQVQVLGLLAEQSGTAAELAVRAGISADTARDVLAALHRAGLVARAVRTKGGREGTGRRQYAFRLGDALAEARRAWEGSP